MEALHKERVLKLANSIADVMQGHDRLEAIDALDVAKILMRSTRGRDQSSSEAHVAGQEFSSKAQ